MTTTTKKKVVLAYSGGLDTSVLVRIAFQLHARMLGAEGGKQ